ncbi:crossover junction endodeoxyribonuclease RuvC [Kineococcus gynurae]|uniref:Crossover junction endodeoxyribonuclease RuvC n=1 Tax=Kineococcus gynurae TaxID=452979 RepID=A0ABV5LUX1_9ACTN
MRVLAVDPGLTRCGLGVVDSRPGGRAELVAVGVLRTPAADPVEARLLGIDTGLGEWLDEHAPDVVAVERVFAQANVRSVMGTAQAAGLVLVAAARRGLPVAMHTPSEVKAAVTGSGRAEKAQVAAMITRILGLAEAPRPADATDALALAVCHLWRGGGLARQQVSAHRALVTGRRNGYAEAERLARLGRLPTR